MDIVKLTTIIKDYEFLNLDDIIRKIKYKVNYKGDTYYILQHNIIYRDTFLMISKDGKKYEKVKDKDLIYGIILNHRNEDIYMNFNDYVNHVIRALENKELETSLVYCKYVRRFKYALLVCDRVITANIYKYCNNKMKIECESKYDRKILALVYNYVMLFAHNIIK